MQTVYHCLGVRKLLCTKFPHTIVLLPVVVYHQHTCRKSVVYNALGIFHHVGLVLIVYQFYPRVVRRTCEEQLGWYAACRRKVLLHHSTIGIAKGLAIGLQLKTAFVGSQVYLLALCLHLERPTAP